MVYLQASSFSHITPLSLLYCIYQTIRVISLGTFVPASQILTECRGLLYGIFHQLNIVRTKKGHLERYRVLIHTDLLGTV